MFKSNSAKEVLYIFLWLIGIILLYTLVFKFVLEPSIGNNIHAPLPPNVVNTHQEATEKEKKVVVAIAKVSVPKVMPAATETKSEVITKVEKITVNDIHNVLPKKTIKEMVVKSIEETKISKPVETTATPEIKKEEKVVQPVSPVKPMQTISVPTVPKAVSMPKNTLSIPSTPSIPSVPSMPNTQKVLAPVAAEIQKSEVKETKKTIVDTKKLQNILSPDEEIKLLETARQHVIEKAEADRDAAMKILDK